MTFTNPLLAAWKTGRKVIGGWQTLPGSFAAEVAGRQGLDYVCVDQQHGLIDDSTAFPMLQGITAGGGIGIVRARWNEPAAIMSALDAGAYGVIIPMIETPEDAAAAVRACRFPPYGQRSYGPIRARDVIGSTDPREVEKVACIIMIETAEAIARLDEIVAVPGLDAVYIGPSDLALALGEKPGTTSPVLQENIDKIVDAAHRHGLAVGIHTPAGDIARGYLDQGLDFVTIYSDAGLLAWAIQQQIAAVGEISAAALEEAAEPATPSVY
ncbi:aldolase/citrate lyase family protein [Microbacterium sp. Bi121]|uniref:HpcH/HpaI aldolase family protein n=1 Tax=Microbacterium sp. Bi121 TaxID=2822348 RepID=UPI001DC4935F|nr:aldolase/citrate lyase family protein [Microbacterium sp. Bi121]CAH0123218.1 5-keto-4-deoxy-D-glucarate aldolase [Microbacterium sp. Bi121]